MKKSWDVFVPYKSYPYTPEMLAHEAFSRGLEVKIKKTTRKYVYEVSDGENSYGLYHTSSLTTRKAMRICLNKHHAKSYLEKSGVLYPKGVELDSGICKEAFFDAVSGLKFPVVLKPSKGIKGAGVVTNIPDSDALYGLFLMQSGEGSRKYIVEEQISGDEYRVFVVGDDFLSAVKRVPPRIIGDGSSTIKKLIDDYNVERKKNTHLRVHLIKFGPVLDKTLEDQGLVLSSVPEKGREFFLSYAANFAAGGRSVDCTNSVSPNVKTSSVNAVKAIPGLAYSGLDVIEDSCGNVYVIELNHNPSIGANHFPEIGSGHDVAGAIIDQYFPNVPKRRHKVYFDFRGVRKSFKNGSFSSLSVKLSDERYEGLTLRRVIFRGEVQGVGFRGFVKKVAKKNNVDGFVRNLTGGSVEVFLAATDMDFDKFMSECRVGNGRSKVSDVDILDSSQVVFEGFRVERTL